MTWNDYVLGDAFDGMKTIEDHEVQLVFTSLPDMSQTEFESSKDESSYCDFQKRALTEFDRIVNPNGFIVISQQDRKVNGHVLANHITYANTLFDLGWILKDEKIIIRDAVERTDLYRFTFQYYQCFTKTGKIPTKKRYGQILRDTIIDYEPIVFGGQKTWSIPFCKMVIEAHTDSGGKVVDPFAAAGPVLYAAKELNRLYWGAELESERYNKDFAIFETQFEMG